MYNKKTKTNICKIILLGLILIATIKAKICAFDQDEIDSSYNKLNPLWYYNSKTIRNNTISIKIFGSSKIRANHKLITSLDSKTNISRYSWLTLLILTAGC